MTEAQEADAGFTKGLAYICSAAACRLAASGSDRLTAARLERFANHQSFVAMVTMFGTGRCSALPSRGNGPGSFSGPVSRVTGNAPRRMP